MCMGPRLKIGLIAALLLFCLEAYIRHTINMTITAKEAQAPLHSYQYIIIHEKQNRL